MALIMPTVLILMAVLIGSFAYLMITAIFQTISNLGQRSRLRKTDGSRNM